MHLSFVELLQVTILILPVMTPEHRSVVTSPTPPRPLCGEAPTAGLLLHLKWGGGAGGSWSERLRRGSEASGTEANGFSNRILKDGGVTDTASKVLE